MDDVEERAQLVHLMQLARQRAGKIEAKPVDVHLQHPVAQAVHDELQHARMPHVQRVAAAGVIHVVARLIRDEAIIGAVVDAAQRQRRPQMVALRGVVVDDVQDHFQPRQMQVPDHRLEFADFSAGRRRARITRVRREKRAGVVAPVIREAAIHQMPVVGMVMHRHQLYRGDAQIGQVPDRFFRPERGVSSPPLLRNLRMQFGVALDMQLIDDRLVPRRPGRQVAAPGEGRIDHRSQRRERGVVTRVEGKITSRVADPVSVHLVATSGLSGRWLSRTDPAGPCAR